MRAWRLRPESSARDAAADNDFRCADSYRPGGTRRLLRAAHRASTNKEDGRRARRRASLNRSTKFIRFPAPTVPSPNYSIDEVTPMKRGEKKRRVTVYVDTMFESQVDRPERPGRFFCLRRGSLVTAGARPCSHSRSIASSGAAAQIAYRDTQMVPRSSRRRTAASCRARAERIDFQTERAPCMRFRGRKLTPSVSGLLLLDPYDREAEPGRSQARR